MACCGAPAKCQISGTVKPGYEAVKRMFTDFYEMGYETESQLCVYVEGEMVIDLWGNAEGT